MAAECRGRERRKQKFYETGVIKNWRTLEIYHASLCSGRRMKIVREQLENRDDTLTRGFISEVHGRFPHSENRGEENFSCFPGYYSLFRREKKMRKWRAIRAENWPRLVPRRTERISGTHR